MLTQLDYIVFEGRNKEYGAFQLRKAYSSLLFRSLLLSSLLFTLVFGGVFLYYIYKEDPSVRSEDFILTYEMMKYGEELDLPVPPDAQLQRLKEETVLPRPELTSPPEVVNKQVQQPEPKEPKPEITDTTAKTGDHLSIKGPAGDGADTGMIYIRVERLPEFPGGRTALDKFLRDNVVYPQSAITRKISGVVQISFVVDATGKVEHVKVVRSLDPTIDLEAVRVVRAMPLWSPGRRSGKPVKVQLVLPIRFISPK